MAANPVTDHDRSTVRAMWTEEHSISQIAELLHRTHGTIQYIAATLGLGEKPVRKHQSLWTDDLVEMMKTDWLAGDSARQIALKISAQLGFPISRNMVIGKLHRMGHRRPEAITRISSDLSNRMSRKDSIIGQQRAVKRAAAKVAKSKPTKTAVANPDAGFGSGNIRQPWVIVTDAAWDVLPGTEPKTLLNRRNFGECKYPVGMDEPEQRFCCARTAQTYCDAHRAIMYRPNPDKLDVRHLVRIR
jgi:hypothetical protein